MAAYRTSWPAKGVRERLIMRYTGRHDPEVVRQTVAQVTDLYTTVEVHAFVPVLIERDARRILDEPAESGPPVSCRPPMRDRVSSVA